MRAVVARAGGLLTALVLSTVSVARDAMGQGSSITPGAREIIALTFANTAVGEFPKGLRLLKGSLEVVDKDGVGMLRATTPSEFRITLPEALPEDFTLEFDLMPKECCNPEDLAFEGTPAMSRSTSSAQVSWSSETQTVVGGGAYFQAATPAKLRETLVGQLNQIMASFEGGTLKLYTNGERLYTLSERRFARGRVLRVFLGGQDDDKQAVYLARLRVAAGAATVTTIAQQPGGAAAGTTAVPVTAMPATTQTGTITPISPAPTTTAVTTMPPPAPKSGEPLASGTSAGNVASAELLPLFAPPPPRTIMAAGFTGTGSQSTLPPRAVSLAGFTAAGGSGLLPPRTIALGGFTAVGGSGFVPPRAITLSGFTATGPEVVVDRRSIAVGALSGTSISGVPAPRNIPLAGFTAAGGVSLIAPRNIPLAGFTAAGAVSSIVPRTVTLPGFTAQGGSSALPPKTLNLTGWTATGSEKTP
jgi:hypothetical protein